MAKNRSNLTKMPKTHTGDLVNTPLKRSTSITFEFGNGDKKYSGRYYQKASKWTESSKFRESSVDEIQYEQQYDEDN